MSVVLGQKVVSASGGTISTITGYTVHTFTSSGTFTPSQSGTVEVLVVGAGGSIVTYTPAASISSGGGGGSVIYRKFIPVGAGVSYSVQVGQVVAPISTASTFTHPQGPITAPGGGSGIDGNSGNISGVSNPVGSGGGGWSNSIPGIGTGGVGSGTIGFGFPGGTALSASKAGGGGAGGIGFTGSFSPSVGGNGGIGVSYSITGVSSYYGAGGGGYGSNAGSPNNGISLPQVSIYGRGKNGPGGPGGPDGPGVVIIRYIN